MNGTVARLTLSNLVRGWRGPLLALIPLGLVLVSVAVRMMDAPESVAQSFLSTMAFGTAIPLTVLIIGTGAISTEIDDGSIVYLLTKPLRRGVIVVTKFVVAFAMTLVFAVFPTLCSALLLAGSLSPDVLGNTVGAIACGLTYSALCIMLGATSRHAVVFGLMYILLWENLMTQLLDAAAYLSVQSWGQGVAALAGVDADPTVPGVAALVLCVLATVAGVWYAANRLRVLTLSTEA